MTSLDALPDTLWPPVFKLRPGATLSDDADFFTFCRDNAPWEFERGPKGELVIKMPTGGRSGKRSALLSFQLVRWAIEEGTGEYFDSSTGYIFDNGSIRSPDVSWVRRTRLDTLSDEQKESFLPIVPDFVVELRSKTDRISDLREKMEEYASLGVGLGVLLDPDARRAEVYRPGRPVDVLADPHSIDCGPDLPGFVLDCAAIFDVTL
jgi:Uma2 family endonuclease